MNPYAALPLSNAAEAWEQRWKYLVYAPGWSHDGPDQRAATLCLQAANSAG